MIFTKQLLRWSVLLIIFLTPLLGFTSNAGFEHTKVLFFISSVSFMGICWLFCYKNDPLNYKFKLNKISLSASIFIGFLLLTSLLGEDPQMSLLGKYPYYQGWVTYLYLLLFSLLISSSRVAVKDIGISLGLSSLIVSFVSLEQLASLFADKPVLTYAGRVVSTFGQPNLYSGFLLLSIPFTFFTLKHSQKMLRIFWAAVIIINIWSIVISKSRAAILVLGFLILVFLIYQLKGLIRKIILCLVVSTIGLSLFGSIFLSTGIYYQEFLALKESQFLIKNSPEKRYFIYQHIIDLIIKRPFLGYGLESIDTVFPKKFNVLHQTDAAFPALKNLNLDRSHNYFLDLLFFSGLVGFISWCSLIWLVLRKSRTNKLFFIWFLVYLIWIQLQIQSIVHLMLFWILVGLLVDNKSKLRDY